MNSQVGSSVGDLFGTFSSKISANITLICLLGAVVAFLVALYGYKFFKLFVAILCGGIGLALGSGIGYGIYYLVASKQEEPSQLLILIPIVLGLALCIWLARKGYKNPFGLIKFVVGFAAFFTSAKLLLGNLSEETLAEMGKLAYVVHGFIIPALITALVCALVHWILSAVVMIGTSYGGAFWGSVCLLNVFSIPKTTTLCLILGAILGTGCLIFQIKNNFVKCTLKEFLFKHSKKDT